MRASRWSSARTFLTAACLAGTACATTSGTSPPARKPAPARPTEPPTAEPPGTTYQVQPGDTLWGIAQRLGSSVDEIAEVNGLDSPHELTAGQTLFIPAPDTLAPSAPVNGRAEPRPGTPPTPATPPPLAWPLDEGVLFSEFGPRQGAMHDGIDLGAPEGSAVRAAADGEVLFAGKDQGAFGLIVIIRHAEDRVTVYAHNQVNLVKEGDKVKQGQTVARVGRTGYAESPHLHFELRQKRKPLDPTAFMPPE